MKLVLNITIALIVIAMISYLVSKDDGGEGSVDVAIDLTKKPEKPIPELEKAIPKLHDPVKATAEGTRIDNTQKGKILEYYASGRLRRETPIEKDLKHGTEMFYFDNVEKKVSQESSFFTGKLHGRQMSFFENGKVKSRVNYQENKLNGLATFYHPNGKVKSKCRYENGKKVGEEMNYDEAGEFIGKVMH